jgi:oxygen-independent coproporphyrinogen-3 oxidase
MTAAIALEPDHFSVYELTVEEGTPFGRLQTQGELVLPDEKNVIRMLQSGIRQLRRAGYQRYEISNYCRPGFACQHNINYWENGSYLGLGAGAISCFSGVRLANVVEPLLYIERATRGLPVYSDGETLPLEPRFRETVIMGLRMTAGLSIQRLHERFGLTPSGYYGDILENLLRQKLVHQTRHRLRLTAHGLMVANRVLAELV